MLDVDTYIVDVDKLYNMSTLASYLSPALLSIALYTQHLCCGDKVQ